MTHRLSTNYAKNYCNRTLIVKVIVENVVTCFFGTRCSRRPLTLSQATQHCCNDDQQINRKTEILTPVDNETPDFFRLVV